LRKKKKMKHWNENYFSEWLYGLKNEDHHLEECPECRGEMQRLRMVRARITRQPELSQDFLAAQRRGIYRRLYQPRHNWVMLRWALPAVMVLAMVFGLTLERGRRAAPAISDEQLFSDLSAIEQSAEPRAIAPMHKLFEQ
jgi:predicted anti-sigma-YlaC factor YlaD